MAASFAVGLSSVFTPLCLLCILGGVFIGIIFGAVPGAERNNGACAVSSGHLFHGIRSVRLYC